MAFENRICALQAVMSKGHVGDVNQILDQTVIASESPKKQWQPQPNALQGSLQKPKILTFFGTSWDPVTGLSWVKLRNGKRMEFIRVHLNALGVWRLQEQIGYGSTLLSPIPETLPRSSQAAIGQISCIGPRDFELRLQMAASWNALIDPSG